MSRCTFPGTFVSLLLHAKWFISPKAGPRRITEIHRNVTRDLCRPVGSTDNGDYKHHISLLAFRQRTFKANDNCAQRVLWPGDLT